LHVQPELAVLASQLPWWLEQYSMRVICVSATDSDLHALADILHALARRNAAEQHDLDG
jgi:hypothetical protein